MQTTYLITAQSSEEGPRIQLGYSCATNPADAIEGMLAHLRRFEDAHYVNPRAEIPVQH
jgi:hypothetical protein